MREDEGRMLHFTGENGRAEQGIFRRKDRGSPLALSFFPELPSEDILKEALAGRRHSSGGTEAKGADKTPFLPIDSDRN